MAAESNNTAQRTCPSCPPLNPLALFTHATPDYTFDFSSVVPNKFSPSLARLYSTAAATDLLLRPGT